MPGDCAASIDGEAWFGGGGGVCAGESDGDSSELMSMARTTAERAPCVGLGGRRSMTGATAAGTVVSRSG